MTIECLGHNNLLFRHIVLPFFHTISQRLRDFGGEAVPIMHPPPGMNAGYLCNNYMIPVHNRGVEPLKEISSGITSGLADMSTSPDE